MAKKQRLRSRTRIEQNNFIKGLITEASPLSFPENASLDEENFLLKKDGSRRRRLGMDYEVGYGTNVVPQTSTVLADIDTFIWKNASNSLNLNIAVVRIGDLFYFFHADADVVSTNPIQVDGTAHKGDPLEIPGLEYNGVPLNIKYDYSFAHGHMIVTSGKQEFTILSFDSQVGETGSIVAQTKRIQVRDLFGVEETLAPLELDKRPVDNNIQHEYNLRNQGWLEALDCTDRTILFLQEDTIQFTKDQIGVFPSNADDVWSNRAGELINDVALLGAYDPRSLNKSTAGRRQVPKGHHIIDIFNRGEALTEGGVHNRRKIMEGYGSTAEELVDIPLDQTRGGLIATASYMGRVIFAINEIEVIGADGDSPALGSMLFFSKATTNTDGFNKCYAELDPTSGDEFAQLATDGGWLTITGLGHVNSMETIGNSLFIFTDQGVWQVNGGDRLFSATNVNTIETTKVGSIGRNGVVTAENNIFYLTDGGIYVLPLSSESKASSPQNLTQDSVQGFWESIPQANREFITVSYDKFARQVKWLVQMDTLGNRNYYDTELIYDLNIQAFFVNKIKELDSSIGSPHVVGFLERTSVVNEVGGEIITAYGTNVVVGLENVEVEFRKTSDDFVTANKYWTIRDRSTLTTGELTVSEYRNLTFLDWGELDNDAGGKGADAEAFLLTGYLTGGDSATFKRVTYITTHMGRTETELFSIKDGFVADNPSACIMQGQWQWASHPESGRWTNPQQIYKLPRTFIPDSEDYEFKFDVITAKSKLRGKGQALSLLFKTVPLHDCHLLGWSIEVNAETEV